MFSVLTSKIFGGVSIFLLLVMAGMWFMLNHADKTIEAQRVIIAADAAREHVQDAAITAAGQESARQQQAFTEATESGQRAIAEAAGRVRVVHTTTRNGCPTPPQIMGAGL